MLLLFAGAISHRAAAAADLEFRWIITNSMCGCEYKDCSIHAIHADHYVLSFRCFFGIFQLYDDRIVNA
jgi:hypothetical protein